MEQIQPGWLPYNYREDIREDELDESADGVGQDAVGARAEYIRSVCPGRGLPAISKPSPWRFARGRSIWRRHSRRSTSAPSLTTSPMSASWRTAPACGFIGAPASCTSRRFFRPSPLVGLRRHGLARPRTKRRAGVGRGCGTGSTQWRSPALPRVPGRPPARRPSQSGRSAPLDHHCPAIPWRAPRHAAFDAADRRVYDGTATLRFRHDGAVFSEEIRKDECDLGQVSTRNILRGATEEISQDGIDVQEDRMRSGDQKNGSCLTCG